MRIPSGVSVVVSWAQQSTAPVLTDASGNFSAELVLPDDAPPTTVITYRAALYGPGGTSVAEATAPLGAFTAGTTNERVQNIVFTRRTYRFAGAVRNALAGGQGVPGAYVQIFRDSASTPACGGSSASDGTYSCDLVIDGNVAFTVRYVVSGVGQLELGGVAVAPVGPPTGPPQLVARDLSVTPTTLLLSGVIRTETGAPIAGADVRLGGVQNAAGGYTNVALTTGVDGRYAHAFAIQNGATATSASVVVQNGTAQQSATVSTSLAVNAVTTANKDFAFRPTLVLDKKWDTGIQGAQLATRGQSLALGADGTIYAMAYFPNSASTAKYKLVGVNPQTHAVSASAIDIPQAGGGEDSSPVLGPGPNGEVLVYLTSDGNHDGTVINAFNRAYRAYVYAFRASDLSLYASWPAPEDQAYVSPAAAIGADGTVYVATRSSASNATLATVWALPRGLGAPLASTTYPKSYGGFSKPPVLGADGSPVCLDLERSRGVRATRQRHAAGAKVGTGGDVLCESRRQRARGRPRPIRRRRHLRGRYGHVRRQRLERPLRLRPRRRASLAAHPGPFGQRLRRDLGAGHRRGRQPPPHVERLCHHAGARHQGHAGRPRDGRRHNHHRSPGPLRPLCTDPGRRWHVVLRRPRRGDRTASGFFLGQGGISVIPCLFRRHAEPPSDVALREESTQVAETVEKIFADDLHARRALSIANGVVGLLDAAGLSIHAIGRGDRPMSCRLEDRRQRGRCRGLQAKSCAVA